MRCEVDALRFDLIELCDGFARTAAAISNISFLGIYGHCTLVVAVVVVVGVVGVAGISGIVVTAPLCHGSVCKRHLLWLL